VVAKTREKHGGTGFDGEMHITNRVDNDQIVKHIRSTSSVSKAVVDAERFKHILKVAD